MTEPDEKGDATNDVAHAGNTPEEKKAEQTAADAIDKDDPHKVEKLSKIGHVDNDAAEGTE